MFEMESFESRCFLSVAKPLTASVSSTGTLHIKGTVVADKINVTSGKHGIVVSNNGRVAATLDEAVKRVAVQGGAGKDRVLVDLKKTISAKLVGGKGVDVLNVPNFQIVRGVFPGTGQTGGAEAEPSHGAADGLVLASPISGTTSQGFVSLLPEDLGSQSVIDAQKVITIPTRADNPQITLGTHPASTVNDWFDANVDLFAPGHGVKLVVRVEPDGTATQYDYDESAGTVTVTTRSTDGIFFGRATVDNGKGGFTLLKDTVYVEDAQGTKNWGIDTPAEIKKAEQNALPPGGYIVNALKDQAPDTFTISTGDGSKDDIKLPDASGHGSIPMADLLATMLVNPKKVKSDVSTIASGTTLSLSAAKALFDGSVGKYLDVYTPGAKDAGHRELYVESSYTDQQTRFVTNADGTVTVTQVPASPIRLVEGADVGSKTIVATMFSPYAG